MKQMKILGTKMKKSQKKIKMNYKLKLLAIRRFDNSNNDL